MDTFSFGLVLLCLAVGDIEFVRLASSAATGNETYLNGWRPPFRFPSGEIANLIRAMWSGDFRQRPAMKDVVGRLKASVSLFEVDVATAAEEPASESLAYSVVPVTEHALQATNRVLLLEVQKLKAKVRQQEMLEDSETGILGGMYEFVPDRERSILGKGASLNSSPRFRVRPLREFAHTRGLVHHINHRRLAPFTSCKTRTTTSSTL